MLFAGHLIGRSGDAAGNSNEDGWPETTNISRASSARIGFGRRIVELNLKIFRNAGAFVADARRDKLTR